ncbi:low molecular weight phosphatase family protein [Nesterenkonia sp. AY15]|uniref:arsenate reductase/protein-tyrosine-phosphatase family protein n=1 Tax=Nesterenkonia sp. AY15 TaxID=2901139 RepID=UPI001F4CBF44|nr:low molecular weight phosphatase family protein [Nesterenkonia sp. AY15]MCH8569794.1 low molecular weight phosphatase family protein [Nesterenkonia sp. AY15]
MMPVSDDPFRVLVVCTGNICRSPQTAQLLQAAVAQAGESWRSAVVIASAGTRALEGAPMDEQAAALSLRLGADATGHTARQLTPTMVEEADLVLGMAREHRSEVVRAAPRASRKAFLLTEFADLLEGVERASAHRFQPLPSPRSGLASPLLPDQLRQGVERAAAQRGMIPPRDPDTMDVLDPYGHAPKVYRASAEQVQESLARIHGSVRKLAQGVPW